MKVSYDNHMDESANLRKIAQKAFGFASCNFLLLCNFPPNCTLIHAVTYAKRKQVFPKLYSRSSSQYQAICIGNGMDESAIWEKITRQQENRTR